MPARLRPTAPIATDAILVGDPGRALMLAQELLAQPKMSNHARGLWGYSGVTEAGNELTIQSTGMGGPSATVVINDLAELGVRRAVRIGTCSSLGDLQPGELVLIREARAPAGGTALPDRDLTAALAERLGEKARAGAVASLDTLHRPGTGEPPPAAEVADMQTAALFEAGATLGVAVAAVLVVAHAAEAADLEDEKLSEAVKVGGIAAAAILSP
jgi:uridine phosphorylase